MGVCYVKGWEVLPESWQNGSEQKWSQHEQGLDYLQLANR